MKYFLQFSATILCLVLAASGWMVATGLTSALGKVGLAADSVAALPAMLNERVAALQSSVDSLPSKVLPPVLARIDSIAGKADAQITALRTEVIAQVSRIESDANSRTTEAIGEIRDLRHDVKPTLDATAALVKDAQDSLDDSYDDVRGLLDSSTVAATQTAQTMQAVRAATPELLRQAAKVGDGAAGVAQAAKREADELTKPQTTRQKIFGWLGIIPRVVRVIL